MNITQIFSNLGVPQAMVQDVMLVVFIAFLSFVYGMLVGRYRLIPALINIYASFAIASVVPESFLPDYMSKLVLFLALWAGLTVFSRKFFDVPFYGAGSSFLWRVFSMSFLQDILLLSIIFSIVPKTEALGYISPNAYKYLVEGWAPFIWMALPLVYLIFIYKRSR